MVGEFCGCFVSFGFSFCFYAMKKCLMWKHITEESSKWQRPKKGFAKLEWKFIYHRQYLTSGGELKDSNVTI